uniref:PDZ domain-containing protein n=1 Tax=Calcidiscus leptoporus TaxID=127549 RepID=A0A7S0P1K6_9EUKA|mmetsp:Transcript_4748/g.10804  ORF Transcript_4748/g.10804 Transcript_4748/m.10804 type:complete len:256 (+) Transcript_4748:41-808(+)
MGDTLFVKIERLRRLFRCTTLSVRVQRGEGGGFGLGLSEDNEILEFHHATNAQLLHIGDQVRSVNDVPLVRERLGTVLKRFFPDQNEVELAITRAVVEPRCFSGEVFASLRALSTSGATVAEWPSDLWKARPDVVWGAFWTVMLPPATRRASFALHRSLMLTDPLYGHAVLDFSALDADSVSTRWHMLRADGAVDSEAVGEVLLSIRRYSSLVSVSPGANLSLIDGSDEELCEPTAAQHQTEPLPPVCDRDDTGT